MVIGGQLFSKSLRGLTVYKVNVYGLEGLLTTMALLVLPFFILWLLVKILPLWPKGEIDLDRTAAEGTRPQPAT